MPQKNDSPHFESPTSASDQEFTYMAVGMVAGAIPGIALGLIIALFTGHAAMWVSITGGIGIFFLVIAAKKIYTRKHRQP